jgi:hypothetical protein
MPEMELRGADVRLSLISGMWGRLFAYMFWPGDERQRKAYPLKGMVEALSSIERQSAGDPDYAAAYDIVHDAFRAEGGWRALAEAGFPVPAGRGKRLRTVAAILDVIRRTPCGEGSVNKAVHVISETGGTYRLITNRTGIFKAWASHRSVAHLAIALMYLGKARDPRDFDDPQRLARFVAVARDYQAFAISYRPRHQQKPVVTEAESWSFPTEVAAPARWGVRQPLPPLPADMLAALDAYEPPK